ncbi:MAG: PTS sugar transporter subunit IIA [Gammaproteobacteria bacterium]|nr:PTS sugar transporter subunit IIA [Gammaproteobacteria bacterium]
MKTLINKARISCQREISSKKRALEILSELLAVDGSSLSATEIFFCLLERERLGSTGLGHGVGIPHGRIKGLTTAKAALLCLQRGVDYDSVVDNQPVDIIMALLFPEECSDQHLNILANVAKLFHDEERCARIRAATTPDLVYEELLGEQIVDFLDDSTQSQVGS